MLKGKSFQPRILYLAKTSLKNEGEINSKNLLPAELNYQQKRKREREKERRKKKKKNAEGSFQPKVK